MTETRDDSRDARAKSGRFWIGVVLVLLGIHTLGMFIAIHIAISDQEPLLPRAPEPVEITTP